MRKKLSVFCATFLLSLLMTVPAFAADSSFSDIPADAPYAESVAYLVEHGITNGTGADTFSPDVPITVRQWSVMLCRAFDLPIVGNTWEEISYNAMVEAYSHGWMYSSIFSAPDTLMCRGAIYDSAFSAAGVPVYDSTLYESGGTLIGYENLLRIAGELQLCDSGADPQEIVTRTETAQLLHAMLTQDLTVEAPTAPVTVKNPADINANKFLLELRKVPETILAEFNARGWTYSIDFDRVAQFAEQLNVSCIGVTDYASKTIYISEASATVHEFGHFLIRCWASQRSMSGCSARKRLAPSYATMPRPTARNISRTALCTGSGTAATPSAWSNSCSPPRRPTPILRRWLHSCSSEIGAHNGIF